MTPMNGLGIGTSKFTALEGFANSFSVDLDGTDDFVNLGNSTQIKLVDTNTEGEIGISIAMWVKKDDWNVITACDPISCFSNNGGWRASYAGRFFWNLRVGDTTLQTQTSYKPFESGTDVHFRTSGWQLFVMTFDGRTMKMWINNGVAPSGSGAIATVDVESDDNPITYNTGNDNVDVVIGGDSRPLTDEVSGTSTTLANFPGLIDEVAIWSKAIDQASIQEIFSAVNSNGVPLDLREDSGNYDYSDSLVGYWRFEEGSGTRVADLSANTNEGRFKNGAGWSTTTPS